MKEYYMIKKLLILLVLIGTCEAGTIRPEKSDKEYVDYGNKHESVIRLHGRFKGSKEGAIASGSGVVIGENWVVTAAHVVDCMEDPFFQISEKTYNVNDIIVNSEFDINKQLSNGDLALCFVKEKIIINSYPELYELKDENEKICSLAGYGLTGSADLGATLSDGKKRAGRNKISAVEEHVLFCDMSKENPTDLEFLIAHGDSGGGLFIDGKLAGIHSFVASSDGKPDSNYGDESGHTRISKYRPWILDKIHNHTNLRR